MSPSTSPSPSLRCAARPPRLRARLVCCSVLLFLLVVVPFVAVSALSTGAETGGGGGLSSSGTILAQSSTAAAAGDASSSSGSVPSFDSSSSAAAATAAPIAVSSSGSATAASFASSSSSGSNAPAAGPVLALSPWVPLASVSTWVPRLDFGAAQCGNRTLLFGGQLMPQQTPLNDVHSTLQGPSAVELQWAQLAAAPWTPRYGAAVSALNSTAVLMIAGAGTDSYPAEVWTVDCADDAAPPRWTPLQIGVTAWPARKLAASAVWRGELVLMGGAGTRVVTLNDVYTMDLQSLAWTARPDAEWTPRFSLQAAVLGDALFVCGGNQSPGYLNDVWRLAEWGAQWVQFADAPFSRRLYMSAIVLSSATLFGSSARSAAAAAQSSQQATSVWLLSGGVDYSHPVAYNTVFAFDGAQWTSESDAQWVGRYDARMVSLSNSTLMMLGGQTDDGGLNDVWTASFSVTGGGSEPTAASSSTGINPPPPPPSFSSSSSGPGPAPPAPFVPPADGPALSLLSEFVPLPSAASWSPRSGFGAVLCGSQVLVLGGFALSSPYWLNEVHSLSPAAGSWSQVASAPWSGRDQFAVSRLNGSAILLTGGAAESGPSNDVWAARCGADAPDPQWSLLSSSAPFPPRFAHASVRWGAQLVLLGGSSSGSLLGLNDVWTMDLTAAASAASQWVARPLAPWSARQSFAAAVLGSSLFVSGGVTVDPPFTAAYLNDVWMLSAEAAAGWAADAWTQLAPASFSPRAYLASAALNGTAWIVCGGQSVNDTAATDPFFRFNGSWVELPTPQWSLRQGSRLVDLSGAGAGAQSSSGTSPFALLLLGGSDAASVPLNDVWAAYIGPAPAVPSSDSASGFRWSSGGGVIAILVIIGAIAAVPLIALRCWRRRAAGRGHTGYTRDYSQADHSLDAPILDGATRSQPVY